MSSVNKCLSYDGSEFYMADRWDRASCYASLDSLNSVINSVDALEGRITESEDCLCYLNDTVATVSANSSAVADRVDNLSIGGRTISLSLDDLNERFDVLSKKVDDLISGNGFGNSFLKLPSRIKRRDFKTLNR